MNQQPSLPTRQTAAPAVLLVDDHPPNLLVLEAVLAPLGLRLVRATSGNEALRHLLHDEFAAIILDVQMPDMDGFETATLIRGVERTREVPIIFVSAIHREDAYRSKGYAHGAMDYLTKPFDADALRAKVAALADLWRRGESIRAREIKLFERERAALLAREQRAQAEAASSAELLDAVIAGAPVGIAIFDRDLRCERINAALAGMNGASIEAHLGRTPAEILPRGSETAAVVELLKRVFATGEPMLNQEVAWQAGKPSGRRYSLASCFPVRVGGEVARVAITVVDVTARRAAEDRAAAERDNFHRMIMQAPVAIALLRGPEHVFEMANPLYLRVFGRDDVVGKRAREVFPGPEVTAPGLWEVCDRAYATGEPFTAPEYAVTWDPRGDGSLEQGIFSLTLTPVRDATGTVTGLMAVAVEVTDRASASASRSN
jgi:PAS domain S-box-containing protein